jgi:hypothetical protein
MFYKKDKKIIKEENLQSKFSLQTPNYKLQTNKAFVSMIALLLSNIFLVIGLSVFNIALREIVLSSGARESLFAFYAADGGMECALYWDIEKNHFSTDVDLGNINCSEQDIPVIFTDCGADCSRNVFSLNYPSGSCVNVEVKKLPGDITEIKSFGQNTCVVSNKNRVERAWRVTY